MRSPSESKSGWRNERSMAGGQIGLNLEVDPGVDVQYPHRCSLIAFKQLQNELQGATRNTFTNDLPDKDL